MYKYAIAITNHGEPGSLFLHDTLQSLSKTIPIEVIDTSKFGSLASAWNYALKKYCIDGDYDAVIVTNDDVLFDPDTPELLVDCLLRRQFVEQLPIERECLVIKAWDRKCRQYYHIDELRPAWRHYAREGWFCFVASRKLVDTVGWFDENIEWSGEDTDMAYRIYRAGYIALSYPSVWHHSAVSGGTTEGDAKRQRSYEYFIRKYGHPPNQGEEFEKLFEFGL